MCLWSAEHRPRPPGTAPLMSGSASQAELSYTIWVVWIDGAQPSQSSPGFNPRCEPTAPLAQRSQPRKSGAGDLRSDYLSSVNVLVQRSPRSAGPQSKRALFAATMGPDAGAARDNGQVRNPCEDAFCSTIKIRKQRSNPHNS